MELVVVTIGIPTKNSEKTIGCCLKSILSLNFDMSSFEVIIVDGGSTDNTVAVAQNMLNEHNVKHRILYDKRRGVAYARQMILDNAFGDYIVWIDSDNIVPPDFIEKSLGSIKRDSRIGAVYPATLPIGSSSIVERVQVYYLLARILMSRENKTLLSSSTLATSLGMQGTTTRVEALKDVGGFDTSLLAGEDIDAFIRMNLNGWRLELVNTILFYYVRRSLRAAFKQAMHWGYGRYFVANKHRGLIHPILELVYPSSRSFRQIPLPITYTFSFLKVFHFALRTFKTLETFLVPMYYFYRRVGFFIGHTKAKKAWRRYGAY